MVLHPAPSAAVDGQSAQAKRCTPHLKLCLVSEGREASV